MATYKVIQDIEAEDHILGPLTLRQFIYGLITIFFLYLCFISVAKHVAFLLVLFFPPAAFCGFFAFPFKLEQPTEVWALAKFRFFIKPRKRLWNQSGTKDLVTITVPKKIEVQLTDGLSQTEVQSRLQALANTIDSRGWAIKNTTWATPSYGAQTSSDRLLSINSLPQAVPDIDVPAEADVLDETTSPLAQQFQSMINIAEQQHRQQLIDRLATTPTSNTAQAQPVIPTPQPQQQWFAQQPAAQAQPITTAPVQTAVDEASIAADLRAKQEAGAQATAKLHTIPEPATAQTTAIEPAAPMPAAPSMTPPANPAILNLAKNNDLNVATLAREAKRADDDGEVVIALH